MALPMLVRRLVDSKLSKYCARKIPPQSREELKLFHTVKGNSVTLLESRPYFVDPSEWTQTVIAQFRYDPKGNIWSLYAADRNSKWHFYDCIEPTPNLDILLAAVDRDETGIFWG